ncbi:MAG: BACON domain-containing protein [Bacteroidales bacterium]|nr:BACON domain-containing protein [Bacteroidales bacterium]
MKRALLALAIVLPIAGAFLSVNSCEKYRMPELSLSADTLLLDSTGHNLELIVSSNVMWYVDNYEEVEWCELYPFAAESGDTVSITIAANEGEPRSVSYEFSVATLKRILYIQQEGVTPPDDEEGDTPDER